MNAEQREELEKVISDDMVIVDIDIIKIGVDGMGLPKFEARYINPPKNHNLIRLIEPYGGAILQDLDYMAVTDEVTTN